MAFCVDKCFSIIPYNVFLSNAIFFRKPRVKHACISYLTSLCQRKISIEVETKWQPFRRRPFQTHFLEWNCLNSMNISLKFVPKGQINNIPALVQIMAWCRTDDKPLSEPMMVRLPTYMCFTRPQWVKRRHGAEFNTSHCSRSDTYISGFRHLKSLIWPAATPWYIFRTKSLYWSSLVSVKKSAQGLTLLTIVRNKELCHEVPPRRQHYDDILNPLQNVELGTLGDAKT